MLWPFYPKKKLASGVIFFSFSLGSFPLPAEQMQVIEGSTG
jgi:hypothetical protein